MTNYEMMSLIEELEKEIDEEKARVQRRAKKERDVRTRKASIRDKRKAHDWAMAQWEI